MGVYVIDAPIRELLGENLAVPGSGSARTAFNLRHGYREILLEPQAALRFALGPRIAALWFYDASAAVGSRWIDLLALSAGGALINRQVSGDTGNTLNEMTTSDRIYIGCLEPFLGLSVDMDAAKVNDQAATLAGAYSQAAAFATLTIASDGTKPGNNTLAQDGLIAFTVPSDWVKASLYDLTADIYAPALRAYWARLAVNAQLGATVEIEKIAVLVNPTGYGAYLKANVEYTIDLSDHVGSFEVIAQGAGATTINVTWVRR